MTHVFSSPPNLLPNTCRCLRDIPAAIPLKAVVRSASVSCSKSTPCLQGLLQRQHITPQKTDLLFLQDTSEICSNLRIERFAAIILSNDIKKSIQGNLQLLRLDSFTVKIYAFFHQPLFFF